MGRMFHKRLVADEAKESSTPPKLNHAPQEAAVHGSVEIATSPSQEAPPYGNCPPAPVCNVPGWKVV